jgi:phosphate transport system substrate-binding protein
VEKIMSLKSVRNIILYVFAALSVCSSILYADTIEFGKGKKIEGEIYVIKDGFHYLKIHKSNIDRVRYASKSAKADTVIMKDGLVLQGKITAFVDDYYYVGVPSRDIRGISSSADKISIKDRQENTRTHSLPAARDGIILRIHGSNTIGAKLAPSFAMSYLKKLGATRLEEVINRDEEVEIRGYIPGNSKPSVIEIYSHGSATAFSDLEKKLCDIGAASRKINDKEVDKLAAFGDMSGSASEHIIALDGIAVIVHKSNPVFKLSKENLKKIFSGEVSDWSDLGGKPGRINVYARDDKSGTWDTFKSLVLGKSALVSSARRYEDSIALSNDVAGDTNSIGFIGLPYVLNAKAVAVSDGAEPIAPDRFTIATEDYPLSRRLFFYTQGDPSNAHAKYFIEFALSEEGQQVASEAGFVDLNVRSTRPYNLSQFSAQYKKMTENAERLSVNFRFKKNSFELDNRGLKDLDRTAKHLRHQTNKGHRVMLFGFADSAGSASENRLLSEKRALTVRKALLQRGINIDISDTVGFGKLNPVASNDTEEGRAKNRRVEIWVK